MTLAPPCAFPGCRIAPVRVVSASPNEQRRPAYRVGPLTTPLRVGQRSRRRGASTEQATAKLASNSRVLTVAAHLAIPANPMRTRGAEALRVGITLNPGHWS